MGQTRGVPRPPRAPGTDRQQAHAYGRGIPRLELPDGGARRGVSCVCEGYRGEEEEEEYVCRVVVHVAEICTSIISIPITSILPLMIARP